MGRAIDGARGRDDGGAVLSAGRRESRSRRFRVSAGRDGGGGWSKMPGGAGGRGWGWGVGEETFRENFCSQGRRRVRRRGASCSVESGRDVGPDRVAVHAQRLRRAAARTGSLVPSSLPSFGLRGVREAGSRCLDTRGSWLAEEGRQTLGDEGLMDVTDGREGGVAEEQADRRRRRSLKGGGGGGEWRRAAEGGGGAGPGTWAEPAAFEFRGLSHSRNHSHQPAFPLSLVTLKLTSEPKGETTDPLSLRLSQSHPTATQRG